MSQFPHHYLTKSNSSHEGHLNVSNGTQTTIECAPPPQFGGPEDQWSPEDFFSAAISSCFILTFKNVTRIKKLKWSSIGVEVDAQLDKTSEGLKFNKVIIRPTLELCCKDNVDPYLEALHKAEKQCLVTNSITAETILEPKIKLKQVA